MIKNKSNNSDIITKSNMINNEFNKKEKVTYAALSLLPIGIITCIVLSNLNKLLEININTFYSFFYVPIIFILFCYSSCFFITKKDIIRTLCLFVYIILLWYILTFIVALIFGHPCASIARKGEYIEFCRSFNHFIRLLGVNSLWYPLVIMFSMSVSALIFIFVGSEIVSKYKMSLLYKKILIVVLITAIIFPNIYYLLQNSLLFK